MRCPSCEANVDPKSLFCPKCGEKLSAGHVPTIQAAADSPEPTSGAQRFNEQMQAAGTAPADDDTEVKLWEGSFSPKAMMGEWLAIGIVSAVLVVAAVFLTAVFPMIWAIVGGLIVLMLLVVVGRLGYRRMAIFYRLTNQRFIHEHGVLSRTIDRIEVIDIDDVAYHQSFIQRMFNVGTIRITSGDRTHPVLKMLGIENVKEVYDLIDSARRDERVKRGVHIAHAGGHDGGM